MKYRKWSVPLPLAAKIEKACKILGFTARGDRWKILDWFAEYVILHPDLFRKR